MNPLVDGPMAKEASSRTFSNEAYLEGAMGMPLPSEGVLQTDGECSRGEEKEKLDHTVYFIGIL